VRNEGLWQDVNKLLLKKQVEQLRRSNDPELFDVVAILGQIKQLVAETDLPSEQIQTIRNQLAEIDSGVKPQTEGKRPNRSTNGTTMPPYPPPAHLLTPKAPAAVEKMEVVAEAPKETKKDRSELVQNILANTDLMNSLSKMMPSMAAAAGSGNAKHAEDYSRLSQLSQLGAIALTHHSVIRSRPGIHRLLYAGYPNVCKQCGWRCTSDESGKAQMDTHLDWHFRRNRRSQEDRVRKAGPRGWYVDTTTWEHAQNAASDDPADTTVFGGDESEVKNMGVGDLQASTVVAPANHSSRVCPVCKESFEPRFNEDEEEWELVNATMVGDDIYHATCVADRQALSA
ncbi:mRNA 3' end processing factor, partial [Linderina pennispora]